MAKLASEDLGRGPGFYTSKNCERLAGTICSTSGRRRITGPPFSGWDRGSS